MEMYLFHHLFNNNNNKETILMLKFHKWNYELTQPKKTKIKEVNPSKIEDNHHNHNWINPRDKPSLPVFNGKLMAMTLKKK